MTAITPTPAPVPMPVPMPHASAKRPLVTPQRLVAAAGVACIAAIALPDGRNGDALRWWWRGDAATAFGGFVTLLAVPLLVIGSFAPARRGPGLIGALLAIGGAAAWALAVPGGTSAPLVVIASLALIGCAALLAGPGAWSTAPALRWWTLGAAFAALAFAGASIVVGDRRAADVAIGLGVGCASATALATAIRWPPGVPTEGSSATTSSLPGRARSARQLAGAAIVVGLITALGFVALPVLAGWRHHALASARVAMLLVTGVAALGALLGGAASCPVRASSGAGDRHGARGDIA